MGVKGLLQLFKSIMQPTHLSQLKNRRVGIDMYCWLYRGAALCAKDLAFGKAPKAHLHYCIRFLKQLKDYGIVPICVFDGDILPLKRYEEHTRDMYRLQCFDNAVELEQSGSEKKNIQKLYHRAIKIVPDDVYELIQMIKMEFKDGDDKVEYIISPYQADSQLAFLSRIGYVDYVISEDSDLIIYGCEKMLFKVAMNGQCELVELQDIPNCQVDQKTTPFVDWSQNDLVHLALLAGCDFVSALPGVGLTTALKYLIKCRSLKDASAQLVQDKGDKELILRLCRRLGIQFPQDTSVISLDMLKTLYYAVLSRAALVYKYETVWDPLNKCETSAYPFPDHSVFNGMLLAAGFNITTIKNISEPTFDPYACDEVAQVVGKPKGPSIMEQIQEGNIHPHTLEKLYGRSVQVMIEYKSSPRIRVDDLMATVHTDDGDDIELHRSHNHSKSHSKKEDSPLTVDLVHEPIQGIDKVLPDLERQITTDQKSDHVDRHPEGFNRKPLRRRVEGFADEDDTMTTTPPPHSNSDESLWNIPRRSTHKRSNESIYQVEHLIRPRKGRIHTSYTSLNDRSRLQQEHHIMDDKDNWAKQMLDQLPVKNASDDQKEHKRMRTRAVAPSKNVSLVERTQNIKETGGKFVSHNNELEECMVVEPKPRHEIPVQIDGVKTIIKGNSIIYINDKTSQPLNVHIDTDVNAAGRGPNQSPLRQDSNQFGSRRHEEHTQSYTQYPNTTKPTTMATGQPQSYISPDFISPYQSYKTPQPYSQSVSQYSHHRRHTGGGYTSMQSPDFFTPKFMTTVSQKGSFESRDGSIERIPWHNDQEPDIIDTIRRKTEQNSIFVAKMHDDNHRHSHPMTTILGTADNLQQRYNFQNENMRGYSDMAQHQYSPTKQAIQSSVSLHDHHNGYGVQQGHHSVFSTSRQYTTNQIFGGDDDDVPFRWK